jgi:hypothetical protein
MREIKLTREDWLSGRHPKFWAALILRGKRVIESMLVVQADRAHLICMLPFCASFER